MHWCRRRAYARWAVPVAIGALALTGLLAGRGRSADAGGTAPRGPAGGGAVAADDPRAAAGAFEGSLSDPASGKPADRFGVFIGIDSYPGPPDHSLDGCVNDAINLRDIFATTFGVRRCALLTNGRASRAGIGRTMLELVERVRQARAALAKTDPGKPVTVVITYAGHGARVLRKRPAGGNGAGGAGGSDGLGAVESSWVAADSRSLEDGASDVRASELYRVHSALAAAGAQVIFITDACHSGSGFRGMAKARAIERKTTPPGPQQDLFPDLQGPAQTPVGDPGAGDAADPAGQRALRGFVWYAACADAQCAFETVDEQKRPCGRLSRAMCRLLPQLGPNVTYGELASRIATIFATEFFNQTPEFHAAYGKGEERFFQGGFPPPHARILPGAAAGDGTVELDMGSVHGVNTQGRFTFYKDLNDLEHHNGPLAVATVEEVSPLTCRVRPAGGAELPSGAVAVLDAVQMDDFIFGTDPDGPPLPQAAVDKLHELADRKQIALAAPGARSFDVAVHYDPATKLIGIYPAVALPPAAGLAGSAAQPKPIRSVLFQGSQDAERLASNLLYVARVRRLMSLKHTGAGWLSEEGLVSVALERDRPAAGANAAGANAAGENAGPERVDGVPRFREGDLVRLKVVNHSPDTPMYVTLLYVGADGTLAVLYPRLGDAPVPVRPNGAFDFPGPGQPLRASIEEAESRQRGFERTELKVIASDRIIDFTPLTVAPETGARNVKELAGATRGGEDALFNLLSDAMHGGGQTRSAALAPLPGPWAAESLTFDVVPSGTDKSKP